MEIVLGLAQVIINVIGFLLGLGLNVVSFIIQILPADGPGLPGGTLPGWVDISFLRPVIDFKAVAAVIAFIFMGETVKWSALILYRAWVAIKW